MSTPIRTLTRTIAEGSAWLVASTVGSKALGVATTLLVLSSLSVFEFGTARLVLSAMGIFAIFTLPGLTEIVVADMSIEKGRNRPASARRLVNHYFLYNMALGFVGFFGMFFGADLIAVHLGNEYVTQLLKVLSFLYLIGPFRSAAYVVWRVQCEFTIQSSHRFFEGLTKLGLTIAFVSVLDMNVLGYIITYVLTDLIGLLPFTYFAWRSYQTLEKSGEVGDSMGYEPLSLMQSLFRHGKWAVAQGYLHSVVASIRVWMIKLFLGTEAVGLFSAAYGIFQHIVGIMPLKHILSSIIPQHDPRSETFRKLIVKGVKYNIVGGVLLAFAAGVGVPFLVHTLLPSYRDAVPLFEWLLLGVVPGAVSGVFTLVFFALRQQKDMFWVNVWLSIFTCVFLPLSILTFGIYGVAVELTMVALIFTWERYRRVRKVLPDMRLPLREFVAFDEFDRKVLGKIVERIPWVRT